MPTDMQYDNRMMMRDQEEIARRKKAAMNPNGIPGAVAGGMVGGASGGVAANPQVAARPYAPPLTVQEITQKFMGGPANVPTGIPQQSAQNPAPQAAPAKPLGPTFNGQTEQQRAMDAARPKIDPLAARDNRVERSRLQETYNSIYRPDGKMATNPSDPRLRTISADMTKLERAEGNYQRQQSGRPRQFGSDEEYRSYGEAGRARLAEQAARIAAERNAQPLPGSTDTWSYEAGQKALPKELQGQVFTHPQDQANYRDFSRFVGGQPSIDPATGMMTSPADREYKSVQQMRDEETMARRKMAQPIDFAPLDFAQAQKNRAASGEFYDEQNALGDKALADIADRRLREQALADAPSREQLAKSEKDRAESERAAAQAGSDTRLIPSKEEMTGAENRSKTVKANYDTANAGTMSLRDQAKANEERIRAEQMGRVAAPIADATVEEARARAQELRTRAANNESESSLARSLAVRGLKNDAIEADLQSQDPVWTGSKFNAQNVLNTINKFSQPEYFPTGDTETSLDAAIQSADSVLKNWPNLSQAQRQKISQSIPAVDLTNRGLAEKALSTVAFGPRGRSFEQMRARLSALQQRINRLRAG